MLQDIYDFYADPTNFGVSWKGINGNSDDIAGNAAAQGEVVLDVYMHFGDEWENAACAYDKTDNSALMAVGDGKIDGVLENPGKAKDILGHEYQHAVTDYLAGNGEGLEYLNEAGALAEGISDIFGAIIEGCEPSDDKFWNIGEDAVPYGKDPVRSLKDYVLAKDFGQVFHMDDEADLCFEKHDHDAEDSKCDNGRVHANSTIPTHAQYRMWVRMPEFFTRQNIGKLWFNTVKNLSHTSNFAQFAQTMISTAEELFPDEADPQNKQAKKVIYDCLYERGFINENNPHVVTFCDYRDDVETDDEEGEESDGKVVYEKVSVPNGGTAIAPDASCVPQYKPDPEGKGTYKFVGWDKDLTNITADTEVHAKYELVELVTHTVTLMDGERVIDTLTVEHGKDVELPESVEKESDERYNYTFNKWRGRVSDIREDGIIYAVFDKEEREYEVKFVDGDGVVKTMKAHYGDKITPPAYSAPEGYVFKGWYTDEQFGELASSQIEVKSDMTIYAKVESKDQPVKHTVEFKVDGVTVYTAEVETGGKASCPVTPTKASDNMYDYTFSHWDGELENVTKDMTVEAVFDRKPHEYTVTFVNGNETVHTETVTHGDVLTLPQDEQIQKEGYEFKGWYLDEQMSKPLSAETKVTSNMTVYGWYVKASKDGGKSSGCGMIGGPQNYYPPTVFGIGIIAAAFAVVLMTGKKNKKI